MIAQDSTDPTGVKDLSPRGSSEAARARERKANAALALRRDNNSWDEIAEILGYPTPRAALVATEKALEDGLVAAESQEFMRRMASSRLDQLLYAIWEKATNAEREDQATFVTKARELIMDHAKMNGYIAPTEVSIYNPSAQEVEAFVAEIVKSRQPKTLVESDIFEDGEPLEMVKSDDGVYEEATS